MRVRQTTPDKDTIAAMAPFERLSLQQVTLVSTAAQAKAAILELNDAPVLGFDTESKPTFKVGEVSDGPHLVQMATQQHAWVFQLHDPACCAAVAEMLTLAASVKAGFGLGDDRKRIVQKLGVEPAGVLELNAVFLDRGYRRDMGVKGAVAVMFNQRFIKSKKAATSNWANVHLTESQLLYAANDAYAAIRVYDALGLAG